jgi:predicted DNA-binding transcriptional regulator AlpA
MSQSEKLYLSETEASTRYGYSRQWFQRERWKGTGPKFIKINSGKILYPLQATDEWFAGFGLQQSTSKNQEAI